jgi:hypothetical protein
MEPVSNHCLSPRRQLHHSTHKETEGVRCRSFERRILEPRDSESPRVERTGVDIVNSLAEKCKNMKLPAARVGAGNTGIGLKLPTATTCTPDVNTLVQNDLGAKQA